MLFALFVRFLNYNLNDTCVLDPDITANDGIYSRYFIPPTGGEKDYKLTLFVSDNSGKAYSIRTQVRRFARALTIEPGNFSINYLSSLDVSLLCCQYVGSLFRLGTLLPYPRRIRIRLNDISIFLISIFDISILIFLIIFFAQVNFRAWQNWITKQVNEKRRF